MKLLGEYLKLIPKALGKPELIIAGWVNDAKMYNDSLSEKEKAIIIERRLICQTCPFMSENAKTSKEYKELTGHNYETKRKVEHCSFCGCPNAKKTASLESNCGVEDWNEENPDKQLELKWKAINKQQ